MAGMRAVHKKDGTTFKFSGDLREAIEKAEKELKEKDGTERHTFLKWQYDNAKKALETYNRRLKDLHDFIRLGKEELEKKEKAMMNVSALFGENATPDKRCGEGIVNILKAAVEEIYTGGLAKVTLNPRGGVKASISQNAKGEINVERTETKKQKLTE